MYNWHPDTCETLPDALAASTKFAALHPGATRTTRQRPAIPGAPTLGTGPDLGQAGHSQPTRKGNGQTAATAHKAHRSALNMRPPRKLAPRAESPATQEGHMRRTSARLRKPVANNSGAKRTMHEGTSERAACTTRAKITTDMHDAHEQTHEHKQTLCNVPPRKTHT